MRHSVDLKSGLLYWVGSAAPRIIAELTINPRNIVGLIGN